MGKRKSVSKADQKDMKEDVQDQQQQEESNVQVEEKKEEEVGGGEEEVHVTSISSKEVDRKMTKETTKSKEELIVVDEESTPPSLNTFMARFPIFALDVDRQDIVALGGGGGDAKTGIPNQIVSRRSHSSSLFSPFSFLLSLSLFSFLHPSSTTYFPLFSFSTKFGATTTLIATLSNISKQSNFPTQHPLSLCNHKESTWPMVLELNFTSSPLCPLPLPLPLLSFPPPLFLSSQSRRLLLW
jgi:hypothetical protein